MSMNNTNETASSDAVIVHNYLHEIQKFIRTYCMEGDSTSFMEDCDGCMNTPDAAYTMDWISKAMLMELCKVELFLTPLPQSLILDTSVDSTISPYGPNNLDGLIYVCVVKTRFDALRYLFYSLAPVAMDVAVRIASLIQKEYGMIHEGQHIPLDISVKAFILFALWLPHAPQISPIVCELFEDHRFGNPLDYVLSEQASTSSTPSPTTTFHPSQTTGTNTTAMDMDEEPESTKYKTWCVIGKAAHSICKFYNDRGDCTNMRLWWDWSFLYTFLPIREGHDNTRTSSHSTASSFPPSIEELIVEINKDSSTGSSPIQYDTIARWHGARALAYLNNFRSSARLDFLQRLHVDEEKVPWNPHPWVIIDEETRVQEERIRGRTSFLKENVLHLVISPTYEYIRTVLPLHRNLVHIGHGFLMYREGKEECDSTSTLIVGPCRTENTSANASSRLIMTSTTTQNIALLGVALCTDPYPTPILVCGPRGAGKSSLIRELACCRSKSSIASNLLELHVDEEIDSKTLLGLFTVSDIPGEFTWKPGPLTIAARTGKWVLIEDVDSCPIEIQAALVSLLENRILPLGNGRNEKCHANFRMFGTCTTNVSSASSNSDPFHRGRRKVLHPDLWTQVQIIPLPYSELEEIGNKLFPTLPPVIIETVMAIFRMIDSDGRDDSAKLTNLGDDKNNYHLRSDRGLTSVRDLIKLLRRISATIHLEPGASFITESQRMICLMETYDVLVAANGNIDGRLLFLSKIAAPAWGVSVDVAHKHILYRRPTLRATNKYLEIGRCTLRCKREDSHYVLQVVEKFNPKLNDTDMPIDESFSKTESSMDVSESLNLGSNFSTTCNALRLMESLGVSLQLNEPVLLVGETGCGKTSVVQTLSKLAGVELVVQNLSLQTDTADLLGGYRPVEIHCVARETYLQFMDLFASTFSRVQNSEFLMFVSSAYEQKKWKLLSQCFRKASTMGLDKLKDSSIVSRSGVSSDAWAEFSLLAERFERLRVLSESGMAFSFIEGILVEALRKGKWVLLDEINLASSETLQRLCSLLDDERGSLTLTERGDSDPIKRHPDFRLIAAMNPATDNGKKDIPSSIRLRFTEIYVDELVDRIELSCVARGYLKDVVRTCDVEQSETIMSSTDMYLRCRKLSLQVLVDTAGQRPRYSMRTFCRALIATNNLAIHQNLPLNRALFEGFQLSFEGSLETDSRALLKSALHQGLGKNISETALDTPGRRQGGRNAMEDYILSKPFWLKAGPLRREDWSTDVCSSGKRRFVLTPTTKYNIRRLSRALCAGPWPILLEGPTSTGKTTMVEYMAALCGYRCIRINNHEHTDVQEYTGTYATNPDGQLSFQEGLLVQALRHGYWVILDELNLAPSQVLEALNRLLDDNREIYIPEINEVIRPHVNFRLFATQNPSGVYGGRKALSKAFRNRFTELYIDEIPEEELIMILDKRCGCPPSYGKLLVEVMSILRKNRSKSIVFAGKDGLVTPRILIRWAERSASCKTGLAIEGYMILAERLRDNDEKRLVQSVLERVFKVSLDIEEIYWGASSDAKIMLQKLHSDDDFRNTRKLDLLSIAPTKSFLRLITLVDRCVRQKEPVLLVGDTGCGKTTVVQLFEILLRRQLQIVNCHANTDTSDLLGGLRPLRARSSILSLMIEQSLQLEEVIRLFDVAPDVEIPSLNLTNNDELQSSQDIVVHKVMDYVTLVESMLESFSDVDRIKVSEESGGKRRKLLNLNNTKKSKDIISIIRRCCKKYFSLFEWVDGPVISTMKAGHLLLLDEMSLAEDAVLERLNSVLEPSRKITLAEKGTESLNGVDSEFLEIHAHDDFRVFATMNPGGDFGKRELSPALRSRFTEIWVPPIVDRCDIDLVLERSLASAYEKSGSPDELDMRSSILNYVEWFNNHLYFSFQTPKNDLILSLRDILTWAIFIVQQKRAVHDVESWMPYLHGAYLMHLDGLGLGTGLTRPEANQIKQSALQYLENQSCIAGSNACPESSISDPPRFLSRVQDKWGVHPFFIAVGPYDISPMDSFNFNAPTTRANIVRVLRAMQLSKPILLEGSPGTGKTSLIAGLANATGHRLVRINLSEQTDWSDLMGSDLSVSEDVPSSAGPNFIWCDGALLTAIKNGDWVVLDELNLATQSVLEGWNSCLDHRASVYIPELGTTYRCPESFRVFAAQNPLIQGGGRKGLPKSFLNRFTKVYFESMTQEDYFSIMTTKFPSFPIAVVQQMIEFNTKLENDIVINKLYGLIGSPWEFNLRDLFRWGDLIDKSDGMDQPSKYVDTVYIHRLRDEKDRVLAWKLFHSIFNEDKQYQVYPTLRVDNDIVSCGSALMLRLEQRFTEKEGFRRFQSEAVSHLRSLLRPMEIVAHCIHKKWPCLLVGVGGCGKSSIIKTWSDISNSILEEICLTPSTDVSELIGNFEQIDKKAKAFEFVNYLVDHVINLSSNVANDTASTNLILDINKKVSMLIHNLEKSRSEPMAWENWISDSSSRVIMDEILQSLSALHQLCQDPQLSNLFITLRRKYDDLMKLYVSSVSFRWVDGILVQALDKGHWLHLENVNLCSSSVLDRLNPLLESGGEFVLNECSMSCEGSSEHRIIKAHPNFRLFLSMDPSHGEISRAMRNRCVEVNLWNASVVETPANDQLCDPQANIDTADALECMWDCGIRSPVLARYALGKRQAVVSAGLHNNRNVSSLRHVKRWTQKIIAGIHRGIPLFPFYEVSFEIAYSCNPIEQYIDPLLDIEVQQRPIYAVVEGYTLRQLEYMTPSKANVWMEARLLKIFCSLSASLCPLGLHRCLSSRGDCSEINDNCRSPEWSRDRHMKGISNYLTVDFVINLQPQDAVVRSLVFDGYNASLSTSMKLLVTSHLQTIGVLLGYSQSSHMKSKASWVLQLRQLACHRLVRFLEENQLTEKILSHSSACSGTQATVLDISMGTFYDRLDRSSITCSLTPIMFPLIKALDYFFDASSMLAFQNADLHHHLFDSVYAACIQGFRFWRCLRSLHYTNGQEFVGFDHNIFCVQYRWLKKKLSVLYSAIVESMTTYPSMDRSRVDDAHSRLKVLIKIFDNVLHVSEAEILMKSDIVWKKMGHPQVPARADDHKNTVEMIRDAATWCLWTTSNHHHRNHTQISIDDLLEMRHPVLYLDVDHKVDALRILCMTIWATTDEASSCSRATPMQYDTNKAMRALKDKLIFKHQEFQFKLRQAVMDVSIASYDNQFHLEELKLLNELHAKEPNAYNLSVRENLLRRYASVQISPIAELRCIQEEKFLIQYLLHAAVSVDDKYIIEAFRAPVVDRIEAFIHYALKFTSWSITDLRPYQTIAWACTVDPLPVRDVRNIIRSCTSLLLSSFYHHCWFNGFNSIVIDRNLMLPDSLQRPSVQRALHMSNEVDDFIGSPRLLQNPTSDMFFNILNFEDIVLRSKPWVSLENYDARMSQYENLIKILSSPHDILDEWNLIGCSFSILLLALSDSSLRSDLINTSEVTAPILTKQSCDEIEDIFRNNRHQAVIDMFDSVMRPLLTILSLDVSNHSREKAAYSFLYIGLLTFHTLLPTSNVDPGRKPGIKAIQLDEYLSILSEQIHARCMLSGLDCGDFAPSDHITQTLLNSAECTMRKRDKQFRKRIERPPNCPSFTALYRETINFAENVGSAEGVLKMIRMIQNSESSGDTTMDVVNETERNWQQSVHSFVCRLRSHYCYYDDVTVPFLSALQTVQYAVRELLALKLKSSNIHSMQILNIQDFLLSYPIKNVRPLPTTSLVKNLDAIRFSYAENLSETQVLKTQETYISSVLSRINLYTSLRKGRIDFELLSRITFLFDRLLEMDSLSRDTVAEPPYYERSEEGEDFDAKQFRELFPDHEAEYSYSLPNINALDEISEYSHARTSMYNRNLTDSKSSFLCGLYLRLFQPWMQTLDDNLRIQDFMLAYAAAGLLQKLTSSFDRVTLEQNRIGAHMHAFMLNLSPQIDSLSILSDRSSMATISSFDFHHDPCPWETIQAKGPLDCVHNRLLQLINAFPSNSILIAIYNTVKKLQQYDLKRTSLGKMLTGLEVVLRRAQDWEQHASIHVAIGKPLLAISGIVSKWRKLELLSWPQLLDSLDNRHVRYAQKYWGKLYRLIITEVKHERSDTTETQHNRKLRLIPEWMKDKSIVMVNTSNTASVDHHIVDLMKAADTFILTSTVGQYRERLRILDAFAQHQLFDYVSNPLPTESTRSIGLMLESLSNYYGQFIKIVDEARVRLRRPIEKKLEDEAKLAKWDEQSYYSLADSSDKNHRKLIKHLKEYDEVLETPVCTLIDDDILNGIKAKGAETSVTGMMSDDAMFPYTCKDTMESCDSHCNLVIPEISPTFPSDRNFASYHSQDKWILNMNKYNKKLLKLINSKLPSPAESGSSTFTVIIDAIFERLRTLRAHRAKNLKQKALLDLFEALKNQGFTTGTAPLRSKIRDMSFLLQVPAIAVQSSSSVLKFAEKYWQRCLSETARLRDEIQNFGSKYMNSQEMNLMLCSSENCLLMLCQQRSMLASAFEDFDTLGRYISTYAELESELPCRQLLLLEKIAEFDDAYLTVEESLSQLSLILKTVHQGGLKDVGMEKIVYAIASIDNHVDILQKVYHPHSHDIIITHTKLCQLRSAREQLLLIIDDITQYSREPWMQQLVPICVFSTCLESMNALHSFSDEWISGSSEYDTQRNKNTTTENLRFMGIISSLIQHSLLVAQMLKNDTVIPENSNEHQPSLDSVWDNHQKSLDMMSRCNINIFNRLFKDLATIMKNIEFDTTNDRIFNCTLLHDATIIVRSVSILFQRELINLSHFHRNTSKFLYIIIRIFRTLVAQGYCSVNVTDDEKPEGSDLTSTKFDDNVAGTGMGEGEGTTDVSDQIENEEQLLGLKGDNNRDDKDKEAKEANKELNKDEAEKGMEMEADFEGALFDAPNEEDQTPGDSEHRAEEIDREMGESSDPKEEVIDEKLWDEDDDDDKNANAGEKFERNSKLSSTKSSDDIRTKEDQDEINDDTFEHLQKSFQEEKEQTQGHDNDDPDSAVNEDLEENYEEKHEGVSVRGNDEVERMDEEDGEELDRDMKLDYDESSDSNTLHSEDGNLPDSSNSPLDEMKIDDPGGDQTKNHEGDDVQPSDEQDDSNDPDLIKNSDVTNDYDETQKNDGLGVPSKNGTDEIDIEEPSDQDMNMINSNMIKKYTEKNTHDIDGKEDGLNAHDGGTGTEGDGLQSGDGDRNQSYAHVPNPFRDPGNAEKYWHKRLNILDGSDSNHEADEQMHDDDVTQDCVGAFEFTQQNQSSSTQVLANADESNDKNVIPEDKANEIESSQQVDDKMEAIKSQDMSASTTRHENNKTYENKKSANHTMNEDSKEDCNGEAFEKKISTGGDFSFSDRVMVRENRMVTNKMLPQDDQIIATTTNLEENSIQISISDIDVISIWGQLQSETDHLSRRLCEKLRLVMEPLVASKLQGDYRSGKRLNMKRIIGYIASGYRKDKIWLRRTKPAKRDYRVLLAVDNSESMKRSGAGLMALRAMAMLINGMTQLEIGQLGIASFGEDMKILHPFQSPFTSESGAFIVGNFKFQDKRTRTALCVESAMATMAKDSSSLSPQLMILISDGRIERDSRSKLRSILRQTSEQNILVIMLIVEGLDEKGKRDSITNMKEISFEGGRPKVNFFMDNYPFPYYIIVEDMTTLPDVLGEALRQWFEILALTQK